jgi:hypothetical protein
MYPGAWVGAWYGDWFGEYDAGPPGPSFADAAIHVTGAGSASLTLEATGGAPATVGGGAPKRRRRKLWLLETDADTYVFDSEEERERFIEDVLEPRARAARKAARVVRRAIKTRTPKEELRATVPRPTFPDPVPTDALIEARMKELEQELRKSREQWEKQLDIEDEELLWLL